MSLYQEFRPQTFEDVAGQSEAVEYLKNLVKKSEAGEKIPHAYLFFGGHGIGKTTLARIFAKNLGTNPSDVYELDAASTSRKIEDTRELIESVYTLPILSKYKVYILDEAHQLTKDSSSALLKTLEEPPVHVIFILCTTNAEKLLPTVRSRCQIVELKKPSVEQLFDRLEYIAKDKEFQIVEKRELLEMIAKTSNSSYRDAVSNLEHLVMTFPDLNTKKYEESSSFKKKTSLTEVEDFFGHASLKLEMGILKAVSEKNISDIIDILSYVKNYDNFYKNIINYLRMGLQSRFDKNFKLENNYIELASIIKENEALFTSKNLLYFLEKGAYLNKTSDKYNMSVAIFCNFVEA